MNPIIERFTEILRTDSGISAVIPSDKIYANKFLPDSEHESVLVYETENRQASHGSSVEFMVSIACNSPNQKRVQDISKAIAYKGSSKRVSGTVVLPDPLNQGEVMASYTMQREVNNGMVNKLFQKVIIFKIQVSV